jgi:OOP family OmpA-OmpF porin
MIQDPSASQLPNSLHSRAAETRDEVPLRSEGAGSDGPENDDVLRSDDNGALRPEDDRLRQAMAPIMEKSVLEVLERGSKGLIDSLYPLIGRSVRRSVRESLSALAQSVDSTMRDTLTLKQFRWRLEARRKGVSLSQLVMQKSLLFRVEEAFLIHQKTGLLVAHVGARAEDNRDLISGMFTAIQDFVADSFGPPDRESMDDSPRETLGRFQVGDQDVWLFHGPSAYVAVVITGNAAESYRDHFHAVLEEIHERFGNELAAYEGDGEALKPTGLLVEDCLIEQQREGNKKKSPKLFLLLM